MSLGALSIQTNKQKKSEKPGRMVQNSWKFREGGQIEQKFPVRNLRKFLYTSQGCPLFRKLRKILGNGIHRRKKDASFTFYYNTSMLA